MHKNRHEVAVIISAKKSKKVQDRPGHTAAYYGVALQTKNKQKRRQLEGVEAHLK